MAVLDLLLGGGGVWLVLLCGSWLYLTLGLALVVAGVLLIRDSPAALWAYGLIVLATLDWARWEMGLDWWPLTARGNIVVLIGVFLIALDHPSSGRLARRRRTVRRRAGAHRNSRAAPQACRSPRTERRRGSSRHRPAGRPSQRAGRIRPPGRPSTTLAGAVQAARRSACRNVGSAEASARAGACR